MYTVIIGEKFYFMKPFENLSDCDSEIVLTEDTEDWKSIM